MARKPRKVVRGVEGEDPSMPSPYSLDMTLHQLEFTLEGGRAQVACLQTVPQDNAHPMLGSVLGRAKRDNLQICRRCAQLARY